MAGRPLGSPRIISRRHRGVPLPPAPPALGPYFSKLRDSDPRVTTIYGAGGKAVCHLSTAGANVNSKAAIDWILEAMNKAWTMEVNIRANAAAFRYDKPEPFVPPSPKKASKFP